MLTLGRIVAALISGLLLAQSFGLQPFWPLAWIAPIPLLIVAIGGSRWEAFGYGALAGVLSMALVAPYFLELNGVVPTLIIALLKALTWGGAAFAVHAAARSLPTAAAVFVYPALMAGFDTLLAAVSPHSTAGSLAYSQMDFVQSIQIASLGGAAAITFVVSLFASLIAFLFTRRSIVAAIAPALIVIAALGFGANRIWSLQNREMSEHPSYHVAMLAGDDFDFTAADWRPTWEIYASEAETAAQTASVVVLPEKIVTFSEGEADEALAHLSAIARQTGAVIVAGAVVEEGGRQYNRAYFVTAEGVRAYDKHHMVPGFESHLTPGSATLFTEVGGIRMGVAICKDMDFPALSRRYGEQGVALMLVPAWDFGEDAWLHSRMAVLRGVESGFTIVRSAREGFMTVSDPYGRVVGELSSGGDVARMAGRARLPWHVPTLYVRIGDAFGWFCAVLALALIGWTILARRRAGQGG